MPSGFRSQVHEIRAWWLGMAGLVAPPLCEACGRRLENERGICPLCFRRLVPLPGSTAPSAGALPTAAAFRYEGPVARSLVHRMKYRGAVHLVAPLAHAMADLWEPAGLPTDRAVLVPVPLAPDRLRERGYNQALLLSIAVADRVGLPVFDALRRVRRTRSQTALSLAGRVGNLEGAFAPGRGTPYLPVVLIDDVRTTGATLDACALALRAAGYSVTAGVTVFQTPDAAETPGDRGRRGR